MTSKCDDMPVCTRRLRGPSECTNEDSATCTLPASALVTVAIAALLSNLSPAWGQAQTDAAHPQSARIEQVVIAFKTHFDIGYTDMARNVIERYRTAMIDQALEVCDRSRDLPRQQQFVWTVPGWPMTKILEDWEGQTSERKRRVVQACKEGRFVVHALPFTTHTELLELEDLVRGMSFSSGLARALELPLPRDAKMTDVPCHSWILPTLLKHAGVDFLHLGCNAASSSPEVPMLFWWEGPDGSRLLTMYAAEGYGTSLVPPEDWPHRTWLALIHTGDNHGPPRPEEVQELLDGARQKLPGAAVRVGRLSDFADAIMEEKPDLPVVRGDMPDTWIHGPMCDPAGARIARRVRPDIAVAEALDTELRIWGVPTPDVKDRIAAAYENSLLYGEHTWGGALWWVTSYSTGGKFNYGQTWKNERSDGRFKRLEDSWAEHTAYIERTRDLIGPAQEELLQNLAGAVKVTGRRIVVHNPSPWKRTGLVTLKIKGDGIAAVRPVGGDEVLPVEMTGDSLRFVAVDVPAMGYRSYVPADLQLEPAGFEVDSEANSLEGPFFKAVLDTTRGAIASLVEKGTGRELVDASSAYGFGRYLYERFDAEDVQAFVKAYVKIDADWALNELGKPSMPPAQQVPYHAVFAGPFTIRFEQSPLSVTAVMEKPRAADIPYPVTTRITLYRDLPFVDLEVVLHDKPADPWPEAGWICLPLNVPQPQFHLGRLGSIVDPERDVVRGSNRHLFALNGGLAITDAQGCGVGLCPLDHPLVSLDVPGCWKYSKDFVPKRPYVFINLFNNQWTTNFRLWNEGTWASRVRLWAAKEYDAEATLATPSQEARFPLRAAYCDGPAGNLPDAQRGLEVSRKGVLVTALGPDSSNEGARLCIWEQAGRSSPCEIRLPAGLKIKSARAIDLRGQPQDESVAVGDDIIDIRLKAFAPTTVLLVRE